MVSPDSRALPCLLSGRNSTHRTVRNCGTTSLFGGFSGRFGGALVVPAGAHHNVVNTRVKPLKLYTIYSPPQHRSGSMPPPRLMPGPRSRISTARLPNDVWGERTSRSRHGLL